MDNNYKMIFVALIALLTSQYSYAQSGVFAAFVNNDTTICDDASIDIPVKVTISSSVGFSIKYQIDGGATHTTPSQTVDTDAGEFYYISQRFMLDANSNYTQHTVTLKSIITQNDGEIALNDTYYINVYATPTPEILNDDVACGYNVELKANDKWSNISKYKWATSVGSLSDSDKSLGKIHVENENTLATITLTETTGGKCVNSIQKNITLLGSPVATIANNDDNAVTICSNIEDTNFTTDFYMVLDGNAPFDVELNNQQSFKGLPLGTTEQKLTVRQAANIQIASLTDRNGCNAEADDLNGSIEVYDRKPQPQTPSDTTTWESGRNIKLTATPTLETNEFRWELAERYADYNATIDFANSPEATLKTNMNGVIGFNFIETNNDGDACTDTATLHVRLNMPFRYPDGFSPNNDGTNDYLVIEGLPNENKVMVCDSKGKVVFERANYRNDWNAEGVEDGYYVYIFKGNDTKTVKQTLVIKRSK